jgi:hypothetical protein
MKPASRPSSGKRLRADTTVVKTNIAYPVDARLLWDSIRIWDLVFQSAFERKTFRMMARNEVAARHFSEPRHFGYTAFGIRITATGVKGTT